MEKRIDGEKSACSPADKQIDLSTVDQCARCGTCRAYCPVLEESGWESANARGRLMILQALEKGLPADSCVRDSLNTCTTCGICTENCPAGLNPPRLIEKGRRKLVLSGITGPEHETLASNIYQRGNTFGDPGDRLSWLRDRGLLREKAEYVYFAGCMNSYRYKETAARTFDLLRRFGVTMLPNEQCCGSPLLRTGFAAAGLMEENRRQIRQIGAHTVITGCAGCYTTLKNDYPPQFQVVSVAEFLDERISEMQKCKEQYTNQKMYQNINQNGAQNSSPVLNLRRLDLTVTYHDPCHLGRHNRIYDPPRRVIEAVCRLVEMKSSKKDARCCGGGGGVRAGYRELSLQMAKKRLLDVPEGVDYIVTSCPLCIRNLSDAGAGEKVIDLVDLVAKALLDDSNPNWPQRKKP